MSALKKMMKQKDKYKELKMTKFFLERKYRRQ